jgi:hypothetical protein
MRVEKRSRVRRLSGVGGEWWARGRRRGRGTRGSAALKASGGRGADVEEWRGQESQRCLVRGRWLGDRLMRGELVSRLSVKSV